MWNILTRMGLRVSKISLLNLFSKLNLYLNLKLFAVFMSDKAESSGDGCDPDSDDEDDCNDDDR